MTAWLLFKSVGDRNKNAHIGGAIFNIRISDISIAANVLQHAIEEVCYSIVYSLRVREAYGKSNVNTHGAIVKIRVSDRLG